MSTTQDGGKYLVNTTTGINEPVYDDSSWAFQPYIYTLDGRMIRQVQKGEDLIRIIKTLPKGVYIVNGKKVINI